MRENPFIDALEHAEQKIVELRAEIERLTVQTTEAAAFLDELANRMDGFRREEQCTQAAADCRAMAAKLRGLKR